MSTHNQKMELIEWIKDLNDASVLHKITEIRNARQDSKVVRHDWWCESSKVKTEESKFQQDDAPFKHIY